MFADLHYIIYLLDLWHLSIFAFVFGVFFFLFFTLIEVNKFTNKRAHTFNEDNQIKCRATSEHAAIFFLLHKFLQHLCTHWLWLNLKLSLFFFFASSPLYLCIVISQLIRHIYIYTYIYVYLCDLCHVLSTSHRSSMFKGDADSVLTKFIIHLVDQQIFGLYTNKVNIL